MRRSREAGEIRIEHRGQNFAHAIGTEVEAQHAVAILHAAIIADHRRQDELVELLLGIGVRDRRLRIGEMRTLRHNDRIVGLLDALPALVAVHAVVAADHRGDPHRWRQCGDEPSEIIARRLRRRIAPVGERMDSAGTPAPMRIFASATAWSWCECTPPGETRPSRWQVPPLALSLAMRSTSAGAPRDLARRDGVGDARQVLHHHAACADVEVPDLGVAHLAVGQTDVAARRAQEGVRPRAPEAVEGRRPGLQHGVVGALVAPTPPIENNQHDGTTCLHVESALPRPH